MKKEDIVIDLESSRTFKVECIWEENEFVCVVGYEDRENFWRVGYILLPSSNTFYERDYDDDRVKNLEVYGGITYANHLSKSIFKDLISVKDDLWLLGFDAGHGEDGLSLEFMKDEMKSLASQIFTKESEHAFDVLNDIIFSKKN